MIRSLLGELCRIIERKISVYLIGRNMMKAYAMLARCLKKRIGSFNVRLQKSAGSVIELSFETLLQNKRLHQQSRKAAQLARYRKYHPE